MHSIKKGGAAPANPAHCQPSAEEVLGQLRRIVASPDFLASPRNRRFFAHIVERSLRGETVRGYEIGTKVFGRPDSFDATNDPIVRIEAAKLRRDLELYYLKSGARDRVRIDLPKGKYCAVFSYAETAGDSGDASSSPRIPDEALPVLHAALLGWAGLKDEANSAWSDLSLQYPDFLLDPRAQRALESIHGQDARVRDLLLEGLRRALKSASPLPRPGSSLVREVA